MHGLLFLYFCQSCEVCKQLFGADFVKRDFEQRIVRHRRGGNDETRAERLVQDSIAYAVCTGRRGLYARLRRESAGFRNGFCLDVYKRQLLVSF